MLTERVFRQEPTLTQSAFSRLLEWIDDGVESHGERYVEMRRRLVSYFERRNRPDPDGLADETLNRIGRTLEEQGVIVTRPPARYCFVVAKFVLLEDLRHTAKHVHLRDSGPIEVFRPGSRLAGAAAADESAAREHRLQCLDHCLDELRPDQRSLVVDYYRDSRRQKIERRREMAARLGITMNALGIRVCRIRDSLTACIERRGAAQRRI